MTKVTLSKKTPVVSINGRLRAYARSTVYAHPDSIVEDENGQQWEVEDAYGSPGKYLVKMWRDDQPAKPIEMGKETGLGKTSASWN